MTIINCFRMYDIYFVINEMRKERVMNEGNNRNNFASDIKNFMTRINECMSYQFRRYMYLIMVS